MPTFEEITKRLADLVAWRGEFTPENRIQWLLMAARATISQRRKKEIEKLIDYYEGQQLPYLKTLLDDQFDDPKSLKLQLAICNVTKQIIDRISCVYNWGAKRVLIDNDGKEIEDTGQVELLDYVLKETQYEEILKTVNKFVNLTRTVLLRPYFNSSVNNLKLDILTPNQIDPIQDPVNPTQAIAIMYSRLASAEYLPNPDDKDIASNTKLMYYYWTDKLFAIIDNSGSIMNPDNNKQGVNPYGVMPFTRFTNRLPIEGYLVPAGSDLLLAQDNINIKLTQLNNLIKFQTFSIPVVIGNLGTQENKINIGSGKVLHINPSPNIESPPSFDFVSPSPNIQIILDEINEEINRLAREYHISPSEFRMEGNPQSGFAIKMQNMALLEQRQTEVKFYERNESRNFDVLKKVWNIHSDELPVGNRFKGKKFREDARLQVIIHEPQYPDSPQEQNAIWEMELDRKLATPIDYLAEKHGITQEEAEKMYKEKQDWWNEHKETVPDFKKEPMQPPKVEDLEKEKIEEGEIEKQAREKE